VVTGPTPLPDEDKTRPAIVASVVTDAQTWVQDEGRRWGRGPRSVRGYRLVNALTTTDRDVKRDLGGGVPVDPTIYITYVQGMLGYKLIHCTENSWFFQRDEPFLKD
jgi:hypothetical protein